MDTLVQMSQGELEQQRNFLLIDAIDSVNERTQEILASVEENWLKKAVSSSLQSLPAKIYFIWGLYTESLERKDNDKALQYGEALKKL